MKSAYSYPYPAPKEQLLRPVAFLDDEEPFEIKQYTKGQLAAAYGIHLNTLKTWIDRHYDAFARIGYHTHLKVLDPCMVRLFVEIFSTP